PPSALPTPTAIASRRGAPRGARRRRRRGTTTSIVAKRFFRGTHRAAAPEATVARFTRHARALGITRIADITGLDYLGLPVFLPIRPNARALSVSQGKGLDAASARASAFMEAAELEIAGDIRKPPWRTTLAA